MTLCESWVGPTDYCEPCNGDYALDAGILEEKALAASEVLYMLSGQQFPGECEETVRPCGNTLSAAAIYSMPRTHIAWSGITGCGCPSSDSCSCPALSQVNLGLLRSDITSVDEVKVDGVVVSPSLYRLDRGGLLVSLGGSWPCCQDMTLADTEPDTWSITFTYGAPVPTLGVTAAAKLACEFYMACDPDAFEGQCSLPSNVVSIARQGVTISKLVGELFRPNVGRPMRFGITEIDLFLATYNPHGLTAPSVILSPDDPQMFRVTG